MIVPIIIVVLFIYILRLLLHAISDVITNLEDKDEDIT